jgi:glyoxylase-like metal-dependent hydrolase (beta-lactamase superfamily II)
VRAARVVGENHSDIGEELRAVRSYDGRMSTPTAEFCQRHSDGIYVIDTGFVRPRFDAAFLVVDHGRAAYIDTGPNNAVPRLLAALDSIGLERSAVDYVIPTHVHLDHAGGVGLLMSQLPNAKMLIHPRGARHLVDPTALMEGVRAVYGIDVANRDYGELVPVAEDRVMTSAEGMVVNVGKRPLRFMDTPGHARHHHCIWDEATRGWFTGDTFGIVYPELHTSNGPYIVPATAPVQFDQDALHESVGRLLAERPALMYLTHFGAVAHPEQLSVQFLSQVDEMVVTARSLARVTNRHEQLKRAFAEIYIAELRRSGSTQPESFLRDMLAADLELNAQGLGAWLNKH